MQMTTAWAVSASAAADRAFHDASADRPIARHRVSASRRFHSPSRSGQASPRGPHMVAAAKDAPAVPIEPSTGLRALSTRRVRDHDRRKALLAILRPNIHHL